MGAIRVRNGKLIFDFRFQGIRCREQSKLNDSAANRKRLSKIMQHIDAEINLGQFKYEDYFPTSSNATKFTELQAKKEIIKAVEENEANGIYFKEFALLWLSEKKIEWRESHYHTVKDVLLLHLIPVFGDKKLGDIKKAEILKFRSSLAKVNGCSGTVILAT